MMFIEPTYTLVSCVYGKHPSVRPSKHTCIVTYLHMCTYVSTYVCMYACFVFVCLFVCFTNPAARRAEDDFCAKWCLDRPARRADLS